jgi:hypothetical protein
MAGQVEYVNDALPNHRTSMRLFDGDGLSKRGRAAVLGFDRDPKLTFWYVHGPLSVQSATLAVRF